ncbi:RES family NAD+ phosphorylase [Paraburkholderia jirisanensis]
MSKSVTIWRIATDTPDHVAEDKTGAGAKATGGRWNRAGTPMLYCSGSIALACMETLVHLKAGSLPFNRYLVGIDVPEAVWKAATSFDPSVHVGWDALPHGMVSLDAGEKWSASMASLLYVVPSVIVPCEHNVLINPRHAVIARLTFRKISKWTYDTRLMPSQPARKSGHR